MQSNFFLQTSKKHRFDDFALKSIADTELKQLIEVYISNMTEVLYVVQSSFNLMVHAKLQETASKIFERNRMLAYADSLRGDYSDDEQRIYKDAKERTEHQIAGEGFEKYDILSTVTSILNELEKDKVIEVSNFSTLRQSIVIVWSATESLIRDVVRIKINKDGVLASGFFESNLTSPYWQKKQVSFDHLKSYSFDLSKNMGDVALSINSCSNLSSMRSAFSYIFGTGSRSYKELKSRDIYILYKLRNLIAHRNGIIDEKYKNETKCDGNVGEIVSVLPDEFTMCFEASKRLALCLLQELSNKPSQGAP